MSNLEAARSDDRLVALIALRDTLAFQLDTTESQIHAQLAAQYRYVLSEIAELMSTVKESDASNIADVIALRLAGADASDSAVG